MKTCLLLLPLILLGLGCAAVEHQQSLHSSKEQEMTVGIVQKEISVGMSQADVAEVLSSPNIITKDSEDKECWVYDKIASEVSYSKDSGEIGAYLIGAETPQDTETLIIGRLLGGYSKSTGALAQTQKTLTVVIKFDGNGLVESFSYHSSKF